MTKLKGLIILLIVVFLATGCGDGYYKDQNDNNKTDINKSVESAITLNTNSRAHVYTKSDADQYKDYYGQMIVDNRVCIGIYTGVHECSRLKIQERRNGVINTLESLPDKKYKEVQEALAISKKWYSKYLGEYDDIPVIIIYDSGAWIGQHRINMYHFANSNGTRDAIYLNYRYIKKYPLDTITETLAHEYFHYLQLKYADKMPVHSVKEGQATLVESLIAKEVFNKKTINSSYFYTMWAEAIQTVTPTMEDLLDVLYNDDYNVYIGLSMVAN